MSTTILSIRLPVKNEQTFIFKKIKFATFQNSDIALQSIPLESKIQSNVVTFLF